VFILVVPEPLWGVDQGHSAKSWLLLDAATEVLVGQSNIVQDGEGSFLSGVTHNYKRQADLSFAVSIAGTGKCKTLKWFFPSISSTTQLR
jgi:hypothetical protein